MSDRAQITLDPKLRLRAWNRARLRGISLSEYIRQLLIRDLETAAALPVESIFDLGDSGRSDVALCKDELVGEAVADGRM